VVVPTIDITLSIEVAVEACNQPPDAYITVSALKIPSGHFSKTIYGEASVPIPGISVEYLHEDVGVDLFVALRSVQNESKALLLDMGIDACSNVTGPQCLFIIPIISDIEIPVPIKCPVICKSPPSIANAATDCGRAYSFPVSKATCPVRCAPGFSLAYNSLVCTESGEFIGDAACALECEGPLVLNSVYACDAAYSDLSVTWAACPIICQHGYHLRYNNLTCETLGNSSSATLVGEAICLPGELESLSFSLISDLYFVVPSPRLSVCPAWSSDNTTLVLRGLVEVLEVDSGRVALNISAKTLEDGSERIQVHLVVSGYASLGEVQVDQVVLSTPRSLNFNTTFPMSNYTIGNTIIVNTTLPSPSNNGQDGLFTPTEVNIISMAAGIIGGITLGLVFCGLKRYCRTQGRYQPRKPFSLQREPEGQRAPSATKYSYEPLTGSDDSDLELASDRSEPVDMIEGGDDSL
jgi:hypothetical protein